ncbi:hypothetical protein B4U80_09034 [Leptotrombidium deliense]|uniref:Uncharacterized protein n=1 Tax=Leptotrombidium deliense TaxID=299467 RepID=A0A443SWV0_9ACAR|nr:hypothetical protein B4U80_09034 [Leptotrombidium deliense]
MRVENNCLRLHIASRSISTKRMEYSRFQHSSNWPSEYTSAVFDKRFGRKGTESVPRTATAAFGLRSSKFTSRSKFDNQSNGAFAAYCVTRSLRDRYLRNHWTRNIRRSSSQHMLRYNHR